jgi:hypothetical protein
MTPAGCRTFAGRSPIPTVFRKQFTLAPRFESEVV